MPGRSLQLEGRASVPLEEGKGISTPSLSAFALSESGGLFTYRENCEEQMRQKTKTRTHGHQPYPNTGWRALTKDIRSSVLHLSMLLQECHPRGKSKSKSADRHCGTRQMCAKLNRTALFVAAAVYKNKRRPNQVTKDAINQFSSGSPRPQSLRRDACSHMPVGHQLSKVQSLESSSLSSR